MSTTLSPIRVTQAPQLDMNELRDGLLNATAGTSPELDAAHDAHDSERGDHPALFAWEAVVNAAADEILPEVARMLRGAIERRLPWTWER
jgi:hypothetical protein